VREECRLTLFENRVFRRTFVPTRDEKTREWRTLHNEQLSGLYSSPNIVRVTIEKNKMVCSKYGGEERCIQGCGGEI